MNFNKVYESKIYDTKYEELYNFLFNQNIENILDLSIHNPVNNCEKNYETINISIMDISKALNKKITYERVEYYSSLDLHCLVKQLKKILTKYIGEAND